MARLRESDGFETSHGPVALFDFVSFSRKKVVALMDEGGDVSVCVRL